jgi:hypothetical protein
MWASLNLGGIARTFDAKAQAVAAVEAIPELVSEPTLPCRTTAITPKRQRLLEPAPRQPSAREHAERLLDWIHANVDLSDGPITHAAMLEFYTEMLIDLDWTPRPWNPVAHQFRLLTTGTRKVYAWITTTTGAVHRLRIYPIPARVVDAVPTPETKSTQIGSRGASKLRRAA